jgi:DNA-binding transcriptional MerR regulator
MDVAPPGLFTLSDAARITGVGRRRLNYWCSRWGAGLIDPEVDPRTNGGTKLLSEHDLVKVALIPKLLQAGLDHTQIAHMFSNAEPGWWDLSAAKRANPNFLDWIVVIRDWRFRPEWRLVASAYQPGPQMQVGRGALEGLGRVLNGALRKHGRIRGFQVIELSSLKRELLELVE